MSHEVEVAKHVVDGLSVTVMAASLMSWLPAIAALFTIVWTAIRIFETKTVRNFCKRFRKS